MTATLHLGDCLDADNMLKLFLSGGTLDRPASHRQLCEEVANTLSRNRPETPWYEEMEQEALELES